MPPVQRFGSKVIVAVTLETRFCLEKAAISRGETISDVARSLLDSGLRGLLGS